MVIRAAFPTTSNFHMPAPHKLEKNKILQIGELKVKQTKPSIKILQEADKICGQYNNSNMRLDWA